MKNDIQWKNKSWTSCITRFLVKILLWGSLFTGVCILAYVEREFIMMTGITGGIMLAVGYGAGTLWKKRLEKLAADRFDLIYPVVNGSSIIASRPVIEKRKKLLFYRFTCNIKPSKALMADGSTHPMRVPDDYKIKEFTVGVDKQNIVQWVHLGDDQYHCDKHKESNCLKLQHLYKNELSERFLCDLITLLETYSQVTPMNIDHWHDTKFERMNLTLVRALQAV